jgi:hypothetical protein
MTRVREVCEAKLSLGGALRSLRSKVVTARSVGRAAQIALACSAVAACSRDGTAQVAGCRLRRQTRTPARVGPAAVCTSKRCTEQPRVEPVLRGCAAAATRLLEGYAVTRTATRAGALVHHAVVSHAHANRAEAQVTVHARAAIGPVQTVLQGLPRNGECPGQ